jgi:cyclopropane fatty-acyl-phospholipid synthase-like methyltransferase
MAANSGRRSREVPQRLIFAVDLLQVQPNDRILEIGGGTGVAAALICARLVSGHLLGIDRSAKATAAASKRNARYVNAGLAEFRTLALEVVEPAQLGPFDKVVAVNVNVFWVRPAQTQLQLIGNLLHPDGRLVLVYEPPDPAKATHLLTALMDHLKHAGYRRRQTATRTTGNTTLVAVTANPPIR